MSLASKIILHKSKVLGALLVLFSGLQCVSFAAENEESDPRLHSDGHGWRMELAAIKDESRPRVLLIGDSILAGYWKYINTALEGRAYVDRWVTGVPVPEEKAIAEALANGPYDVIHFNWGLHAWRGSFLKSNEFNEKSRKAVEAFRKYSPGVKLIWASATPVTTKTVPYGLEPDINPIVVAHNQDAAKIMKEEGVPIVDFYGLLEKRLELARGDSFHWNPPAYVTLSEAAVNEINKALPKVRTVKKSESEGDDTKDFLPATPPAPPAKNKNRPAWASDFGDDQYGTWATLKVKNVVQRFRWIGAGKYLKGAGAIQGEDKPSEVVIDTGYWLADSELTQEFWMEIEGKNPSCFKGDPNAPVEQVNFADCKDFLGKLNNRVGSLNADLPSDAQWEYACRAGSTGAFAGNLPEMAWYSRTAHGQPKAVKTRHPNAWGLYDMHGNVWEWCRDDIQPPGCRIRKGGSVGSDASNCRAGLIYKDNAVHENDIGLRILVPSSQ